MYYVWLQNVDYFESNLIGRFTVFVLYGHGQRLVKKSFLKDIFMEAIRSEELSAIQFPMKLNLCGQ